MVLIVPIIIILLAIYIYPKAKRYFKYEPISKIRLLILWFITTFFGLLCISVIRELYLVTEEFSTSFFKQGGNFDVGFVSFSFLILIFINMIIYLFYHENIWERFLFLTAIQLFFISSIYLLNLYNENMININNLIIYGSGIVVSIGLVIINRKLNKVKEYTIFKDLMKTVFN